MRLEDRLKSADPARGVAPLPITQRKAMARALLNQRIADTAPRAPRRRLVLPIALATALVVTVIGFTRPSSSTLAWSPIALTDSAVTSEELKSSCTEDLPLDAAQLRGITAESLSLVDLRGNAGLAIWSTPEMDFHCMVFLGDNGSIVRGPTMFGEPQPYADTRLSVDFMAGTEWMGKMIMVLSGHAPAGTSSVYVVGEQSEAFYATLNEEGRFAVWWPTTDAPLQGTVVARDAEQGVLDTLELSSASAAGRATQTAPPNTENPSEANLGDELSPPGGDALDPRALAPRDPNATVGELATISDLVVPTEVSAGAPLVIKFRMVDPAGAQSPVAFIGGPSGWVSTWCGFGMLATLVSGNDNDGVYEVSCLIPASAPNAEYQVFLGCECMFADGRSAMGVGTGFSFRVVGGSSDAAAPEILVVTISSASIAAGGTIDITTTARDESGIVYVVAWVEGPNGRITDDAGVPWAKEMGLTTITSRDIGDGRMEFVQTVTMREDATSGTYRVWYSVGDLIGNRDALYSITLATFEVR
ncbi:MAG: hypothetical protein KGN04_00570 [Chloroflexi bacterium]|nr:hypothetical protein [Chloroflexota bacterium]